MSQAKTKMPLARAQQLAEAVRGELLPGCVRIEVAGSIRRRKPLIGDVELVAIPKLREDLLAKIIGSELDQILAKLVLDDRLYRHKDGARYKQFTIRKADCKLDLFLCDATMWPVVMMIRTGPEDFSRRFVTQKKKGGWLPDQMRIGDGSSVGTNRLYLGDVAVELADEADLFFTAGIKWVDPWMRG